MIRIADGRRLNIHAYGYGSPTVDTDDRIMRIDCEGGGRLSISVPMANDAQLGSHLWVTFSSANFRERRKAEVTEGVVPNLSVKVSQDDPAMLALLSGRAIG